MQSSSPFMLQWGSGHGFPLQLLATVSQTLQRPNAAMKLSL